MHNKLLAGIKVTQIEDSVPVGREGYPLGCNIEHQRRGNFWLKKQENQGERTSRRKRA